MRFKYMAGIEDDEEFDELLSKMDPTSIARKVRCPLLFVTGKYDNLCPIKHVRRFYEEVTSPKLFVVFDREFHSMGGVAGEFLDLIADWVMNRLQNKPSETGWIEVPAL